MLSCWRHTLNRYSGQSLGPNEEYFKVDMGGFASAVTLSYAFGNW